MGEESNSLVFEYDFVKEIDVLRNWERWVMVAGIGLALLGLGILNAPRVGAQAPLTATPSSTNIFRIANEIVQPKVGDAVSGWVSIRGTAVIEAYRQYQVHISPAGMESWSWLHSSANVVRDGQIYLLDSTRFPDGFYDIRVRAIQDGGQFTEAYLRGMEIRNANPPTPTPEYDETGAELPPTPTPTATFTPTPAPDVSLRVPGGQGFYEPRPGSVLRGFVPIIATVNGTDRNYFERYELYLSPAGAEAWTWLFSGSDQLWQDAIYVFNSYLLPDGAYDLRLRVVYRDSNFSEYHLRNLYVANASAPPPLSGQGQSTNPQTSQADLTRPTADTITTPLVITAPRPGTVIAGIVDVRGTATDPNFLRWELHWGPSGVNRWTLLTQGDRQMVESLLAQLDLRGIPAGDYDLRLRVVRQDGNYTDTFVRGLSVRGRIQRGANGEVPI